MRTVMLRIEVSNGTQTRYERIPILIVPRLFKEMVDLMGKGR